MENGGVGFGNHGVCKRGGVFWKMMKMTRQHHDDCSFTNMSTGRDWIFMSRNDESILYRRRSLKLVYMLFA